MNARLKALCRKAEGWGGQIVFLNKGAFEAVKGLGSVDESPFSSHDLAVDHAAKTVYTSTEADWQAPWYEVVHELGHVFACLQTPSGSSELEFLGWEYALARELRGVREWIQSNKDYGVGPGRDLGDLSRKELQELLKERLWTAGRNGLLDSRGRAQAIR